MCCEVEVSATDRSPVQRSPTECVCHWVWSDATITYYTYNEWVEEVRLRKKESLYPFTPSFIKPPVSFCKCMYLTIPLFWNVTRRSCVIGCRLSKPCTVQEDIPRLEDDDYVASIGEDPITQWRNVICLKNRLFFCTAAVTSKLNATFFFHGATAPRVDLGGLVVSVLVTGPKVRGFDPDRGRWIFKGDKNPENHFLRRGSKAVGPMS
jgi:hypothetical protein